MKSSFKLINELINFLAPFEIQWFVSGGWAIDIHLSRNTRNRGDLDISVPYPNRLETVEYFLEKKWQIEAKILDGFKTLRNLSDYEDEIRYFWSFPADTEFISEYIDDQGNRRISYNREYQFELDYIEVFFEKIEDGEFIYRRDHHVRRNIDQVVLVQEDVRYLSPEIVLLFKSNDLSEKNVQDFNSVVNALEDDQRRWLRDALLLVNDDEHPWLEKLRS